MTAHQPQKQSAKQPAHSVIILAAGLSRRLGQPKQLLTQQGLTLLAKTINLAINTHSKPIAIVVVLAQPLSEGLAVVQSTYQPFNTIYFVQNRTPETGLANSLQLAIGQLAAIQNANTLTQFKRVLIMGVDQILLDGAHLEQLLAGKQPIVASAYSPAVYPIVKEALQYEVNVIEATAANRSNTGAKTAVKCITGLPLVIDFKRLQSWQANLTGDKGLRDVIRAMPSADISQIRNDILSFDIDTPAQLAYARAQGWLDGNVMV